MVKYDVLYFRIIAGNFENEMYYFVVFVFCEHLSNTLTCIGEAIGLSKGLVLQDDFVACIFRVCHIE